MSQSVSILTVRRLIAIGLIYIATVFAWFVLGEVVHSRTAGLDQRLRSRVQNIWGDIHVQKAPLFTAFANVKKGFTGTEVRVASDIFVDLQYEPRKKGLLWYNLYKVEFAGNYTVSNPLDRETTVRMNYEFPSPQAVYDNFAILLGDQELALVANDRGREATFLLPSGAKRKVTIRYKSQGLDDWRYSQSSLPNKNVSTIRDFHLTATADFRDLDFPDNTLAPTEKTVSKDGWKLEWKYDQLISGQDIGISVPRKLNPGPFVERVTSFAPVGLFFFFLLMLMIIVLRKIPLHPMHFLFLAAAFFSFHLFFAYLVDHISIEFSFSLAAITSIFLTVTYLRLVVGLKFAFIEAGLSQLVYLVAFTYSFFFEGYTGLIITILAILTLFFAMQMTGRVNWEKVFAKSDEQRLT